MKKIHLVPEYHSKTFYVTTCGVKFLASGKILSGSPGRTLEAISPDQWSRMKHQSAAREKMCRTCLKILGKAEAIFRQSIAHRRGDYSV